MMGTFNGEKYIAEQLDSLSAQTHQNWFLIVSDDGSTDTTYEIVKKYQAIWGSDKVRIRQGPKKGFAQNFLSMACDSKIKAEFYAFCDQDDVWLPEKIEIAIDFLCSTEMSDLPHLYSGRTANVRDDLKPYYYSPEFVFPRTFRNALVQSIAGGNTMVFNQATKTLLEKTGPVPTPSHDWWLYQLTTAAAGMVHYDSKPYILYRQHNYNLVGGNNSLKARVERFFKIMKGSFKTASDQNIESLKMCYPYITLDSRIIIELFVKMRSAKLLDRLRLLKICGLYRQTFLGDVSLMLATLLKRI
jgi:glycosyltransferase involved in cell wall biosynthesis